MEFLKKQIGLLRTFIRKYTHKTRLRLNVKLAEGIENRNFLFISLILAYRTLSERHTLGGLKGYSINGLGKVDLRFTGRSWRRIRERNWVIERGFASEDQPTPRYIEINRSNLGFAKEKIDTLKILAILPSDWSRDVDEFGFPHYLHLRRAAENLGVKFASLKLEETLRDIARSKAPNVIKTIDEISPNLIFISGHKNSYKREFANFLLQLKSGRELKLVMLFLDDWSLEYGNMALAWSEIVDLFLPYEFDSFVASQIAASGRDIRYEVEPFPRAEFGLVQKEQYLDAKGKVKINFIGSLYLSRAPWLWIISRYLSTYWPDVEISIQSNFGPGKHQRTIKEYFELYSSKDTVYIHFLERTPNVFSFTSSVWDAFSSGSLVMVQVGKDNDPLQDFFVPKVHYLRFSSIDELCTTLDFLCENPGQVIKIANAGFAFWRQNYSGNAFFNKLSNFVQNKDAESL